MAKPFDYFVIFAEMRTGSNLLEGNLAQFDGLKLYGEAFNGNFIGRPAWREIHGMSQAERDADPHGLLDMMCSASEGLPGFRYFHDHDVRILDRMLEDPRCGKIVLIRNPLDSYVSVKLAAQTDQWILTDMKNARSGKARFDLAEFERHLDATQRFQLRIQRACQIGGQAPFYIHYDDVNDLEVLNGAARYLGQSQRIDALQKKLKPQNPVALTEKVENPEEMARDLATLDRFDLGRTPLFEPRRGPSVPGYYACQEAPILFLPIEGGPVDPVLRWMAAADGASPGDLLHGMSQKALRQWKRARPGHRSFAVLRHPAARAHHVFCSRILAAGPGAYGGLRQRLINRYDLPVPAEGIGEAEPWTVAQHRAAFMAFLDFLAGNLNGQTPMRVDLAWASQAAVLQGIAEVVVPDRLIREEELGAALDALAAETGTKAPNAGIVATPDGKAPVELSEIYDDEIGKKLRRIYQRDYLAFGFSDWAPA